LRGAAVGFGSVESDNLCVVSLVVKVSAFSQNFSGGGGDDAADSRVRGGESRSFAGERQRVFEKGFIVLQPRHVL
jgi:hypothetical protein